MADVTLSWGGVTGSKLVFDYGFAVGISKDFNRADDGTVLTEKHTINIRGAFISSASSANAKYIDLITQSFSRAGTIVEGGSPREKSLQSSELNISACGISYTNANLVSVSVAEPSEDTAGIQFQEVTLVFESYNTDYDQLYKLRSASENFEIRKDEDKIFYDGSAIDEEDKHKYGVTITHTLSAQGLVDFDSQNDALYEAYRYIDARLKNDPPTISTDILERDLLQNIDTKTWKVNGEASKVIGTDINAYTSYNKIRTSSADIATGSYSVTTTYFLSKEKATIDVSANFNRDESGESSVTVEGTIQGVSTQAIESLTNDKLAQAKIVYNVLSGSKTLRSSSSIFKLAQKVFDNYHPDKTGISLRDYPMSVSLGENKTAGSIAFNVSYKAYPTPLKTILDSITGAIAANITITDQNRSAGYDSQVIVVIPIPARTKGPILQNMNTTKERKRTAVVDVIVESAQRTPENDTLKSTVISKVNNYKPNFTPCHVEDFNESWNWTAGKYTATLTWIYQV